MRTNIINKHGMKLILAILLIVAVVSTSVVSAYFMVSNKNGILIGNNSNGDLSDMADPISKTQPLADGDVPGGADEFEKRYVGNSAWQPISTVEEMQNWLLNNNDKNAYLVNPIDNYVSGSTAGSGHMAHAENTKLQAVRPGRILDGCGNKITLAPTGVAEWTDALWGGDPGIKLGGKFPFSLFAAGNEGIIRNLKFGLYTNLKLNDQGWTSAAFGLVAAYNSGSIYNIDFDYAASFQFHMNGGNNYGFAGIITGASVGTVSNCTVRGQAGSLFEINAKGERQGWPYKYYDGFGYVGSLVGESIGGNEINNTVISDGMTISAVSQSYGNATCSGAVGKKDGGNISGVALIGSIKSSGGNGGVGAAVGNAKGSIKYEGIYSDYSAGCNNTWIVGNASSDDLKSAMTRIVSSEYDVRFEKIEKYYENNLGLPNQLIITPKVGAGAGQKPTASHILWGLQYLDDANANQAGLEIKGVAQQIITGSFKLSHIVHAGAVRKYTIKPSYGTYGVADRMNIPTKTYNGLNQSVASDTIVYKSPDNSEKTINMNVGTMNILYSGSAEVPRNRGEYAVSSSGYYIDEAAKFIGYNPNNISGNMTINPADITFDIEKFALDSYAKTYDTTTDAPATLASPYLTGIGSEGINFTIDSMMYLDKDAGVNKGMTFNIHFGSDESLVNANYTVGGVDYFSGSYTVNRGIINKAKITATDKDIAIDTHTKVYDKTDVYNGKVTVADTILTEFGEYVKLEGVSAKFNTKNIDAKNIIVSFSLFADEYSKNYELASSTKEFANASITPYHLAIDWDVFKDEAFYTANGSSKVTRAYDTTDIISDKLMGIMKPFTTEIGEIIKLDYVSAVLSNKNVANNSPLVFTFKLSELPAGSQDINGATYDLASSANYVLDNTTVNTSATVTPIIINITDDSFNLAVTKVYDGTVTYVGDAITQKPINGAGKETVTLKNIVGVYNAKNVVGADKISIRFTQSDANYVCNITPIDNVYTHNIAASITPYNFAVTEDMLNVVKTKAYDSNLNYVGEAISQKDIKVSLTGGEESIVLSKMSGTYVYANVKDANNSINIAIEQSNTNFTINDNVAVNAVITPYILTLQSSDFTYGATKVYDGNINTTASQNKIIGLAGQEIVLGNVLATFNSKDVATANEINISFALFDNAINSNYAFAVGGDSVKVASTEHAPISITSFSIVVKPEDFAEFAKTKVYDGANVYDGVIAIKGDIITGILTDKISINVNSAIFNTTVVKTDGSTKIIVTISQSDTNYSINETVEFEANITPFVINGIVDSAFTVQTNKTYDGDITVADDKIMANSFSSGVGEETVTLTKDSAVYNSKNVAEANAITVNFSIADTNYTIGDVKSLIYTATITAKDITLTQENFDITNTKQYDKTTTAAISVVKSGIATGVVSGGVQELLILDTLTATYNAASVKEANSINVKFTTANLNYNITNVDSGIDLAGNVTAKDVDVTSANFTVTNEKTYDGNDVAAITGYNITANEESVVLDTGYSATYAQTGVGTGIVITIDCTESLDNYNIVKGDMTLNSGIINAKEITVTKDIFTYDNTRQYNALTIYNGAPITATTVKTGIIVNGTEEELTLTIGEATYNSKNVADAKSISLGITQSNINYTINSTVDLDATITVYTVSDIMDDLSRYTLITEKIFDGSDVAKITINEGRTTILGLDGETFTYTANAKYASTAIAENIAINITVTSNDANYTFNITTFEGSVNGKITEASLIITIDNFTFNAIREYDGTVKVTITGYSIKGLAGEAVYLADGYRAEFNDAAVGKGKTITIYFEPKESGYLFNTTSVTFTATEEKGCEITKRTITLTGEHFDYSNSKVYDGTIAYDNATNPISVKNGGAVATGVGADTISVSTSGTPVYNNANVADGNYIIIDVSMTEDGNYILSGSTAKLSAEVTPKAITIADTDFTFDKSKTYDGNANVTIIQNVINGVTVGGVAETITLSDIVAVYNSKDVDGDKVITITFKQSNANYSINESVVLTGDADVKIIPYTINKGDVTATIVNEKVYDGNITATVTDTAIAGVGTETVDVLTAVASYENKNAGTGKAISLVLTIGNTNYTLGFSDIVYTDGAITKKDITVKDTDVTVADSKVYDGTVNYVGKAIHGTIEGACADDVITLTFGNIVYNSKDVVSANALTVNFTLADGNYNLTNLSVNKSAVITKASITLNESNFTFNKSKTYDGNVNVAITQKTINGVTVDGVAETITLASLTAKFNSVNVVEANSILIEFALSESDTNYTLAPSTFAVEDDAVKINAFTIEKTAVTADVTKSKIFDGNTTVAVANVVITGTNAETVDVLTSVASYDNKNVSTGKTISLVLTIKNTNYTLGFSNIAYTDGAITKKAITVKDTDVTVADSKVYDGTVNYVGKATHGTIEGACGDDVITLTFGDIAYNSKDVLSANALTVNFTQADGNYDLTNLSVNKNAVITPYILNIKENHFTFNKSRVYNNSDVVTISQGTIVGVVVAEVAENINLVNISAKYNIKNVGADSITIAYALADGSTNYKLGNDTVTVDSDVSITPFTITNEHVDFTYAATKAYDATENVKDIKNTFNYTNIGFTDEELSLSSMSAAYDNKNTNIDKEINFTYVIANVNYTMGGGITSLVKTYSDGVITQANVTPKASEFEVIKSRQYTGDNTAVASTTSAIKGIGEEMIGVDITATYYVGADHNVGSGKAIKVEFTKAGSENNKNYNLTQLYVEINDCEITQKQLEITAENFVISNTKVYDATRNANVEPKLISGVLEEKVSIVVNSALFNSENVKSANAITIKFALSVGNINKNYTINDNNELVYADNVAITPAQLVVAFSNADQSYRNNPNPLSKVVATIVSGNIAGQKPVLKITKIDNIIAGVVGEYDLFATSTDTNYTVSNSAKLKLDVFARANGRWLIENVSDYNMINADSKYLAYNFTQTADIDMQYAAITGIKGEFSGSYDGNGFIIKNAFLYGTPLFEVLSGSITNLALANIVIISYDSAKIGGVVGVVTATGIIENVVFEGSIYVDNATDETVNIGGIAAENNGRISGVKVFADITVKASVSNVGGIVAVNSGTVNALIVNGIKTLNRVMVEITAIGAGANVDAVIASNTGTIDANDTKFLQNANVKETADKTYSIVNSTYGIAEAFNILTGTYEVLFGTMNAIDFIKTYRNDLNLNLSPNYVLEIRTLRDYDLIGQYSYLNIVFKSSFTFHKYYEHEAFSGLLIGSITVADGVSLDARIGEIINIFKYNNVTVPAPIN